MADPSEWTPPQWRDDVPSVARMYDWFLGGALNFAVDRDLAHLVLAAMPDAQFIAQANRHFVARAVRKLVREGFDQFLDIGSGLPGQYAVHEIARAINPRVRVVYVDTDPVVLAHGQQATRNVPGVAMIEGDAHDPPAIFDHPTVRDVLRTDRPVVALLAAVVHFMPDSEQPAEIMAELRGCLSRWSVLVFSHGTSTPDDPDVAAVRGLYTRSDHEAVPRTRGEIEALLDRAGFVVRPPGLSWVTDWYPEPSVRPVGVGPRSRMLGAVADVA